jgi:hypothetical protein
MLAATASVKEHARFPAFAFHSSSGHHPTELFLSSQTPCTNKRPTQILASFINFPHEPTLLHIHTSQPAATFSELPTATHRTSSPLFNRRRPNTSLQPATHLLA